MSELPDRLIALAVELEAGSAGREASLAQLQPVIDAANEVGRSWSGSWLGYHSRVYYEGLQPVPPGAHFSTEWGLEPMHLSGTCGDWAEYEFASVRDLLLRKAKKHAFDTATRMAKNASTLLEHAREEFLSIASVSLENKSDAFLSRLKAEAEAMHIGTKNDYARAIQPKGQVFTRDSIAIGQGFQTPPHLMVLAEITALRVPSDYCANLAKLLRRAASHLQVSEHHRRDNQNAGTNVFIGHGRSAVWKDLKDFIQDRLGLPWDEFNRVPVAGVANIARLSEMLDDAAIAFLVMTAEDEQLDGSIRARMNVVHEAGLFQGKFGFMKAIVLIEEGCEEFSNIQGLGQIRFPAGRITAAFEEVRQVLEREGLIES